MGYDIYWVNDPNAEKRDRIAGEFASVVEEDPEGFKRWLREQGQKTDPRSATAAALSLELDIRQSVSGYIKVSSWIMHAIRVEMKRQGMLATIPEEKLTYTRGDVITPREIREALVRASPDPAPPDHEYVSRENEALIVTAFAPLGESIDESELPTPEEVAASCPTPEEFAAGQRQQLLALDDEVWRRKWRRWLAFLDGARQHGGCVVW
jgi:hypothetical protein